MRGFASVSGSRYRYRLDGGWDATGGLFCREGSGCYPTLLKWELLAVPHATKPRMITT